MSELPPTPPPLPDDAPPPAARTFSSMDQAFLTGQPGTGELILVRHGQQQYPEAGMRKFADWVDPPLSELGRRQAEAVGRALAGRPVAAVYSSHLERARRTGEAIAARHGVEVQVDKALREIEMFRDLHTGANPVETFGRDAMLAAQQRFVATRRWDAYPATESGAELVARVIPAVDAAVAAHPGGVVVIACHGGVINAYLVHVLGLREVDMFFRPAHASVQRLTFHGRRRVIANLNEVHHLEPELVTF